MSTRENIRLIARCSLVKFDHIDCQYKARDQLARPGKTTIADRTREDIQTMHSRVCVFTGRMSPEDRSGSDKIKVIYCDCQYRHLHNTSTIYFRCQ